MPTIRLSPPALLLAACLGGSGLAAAQAPSATTPPPAPVGAAKEPVEPRIERIQVDEGAARVDELRVRGETTNITVTPKGGLPSYEVAPERAGGPAATGRDGSPTSGGTTSWKLFDF